MNGQVRDEWVPSSVSFRIHVGDRPILATKLALQVWRGDFMTTQPGRPSPPERTLLDGLKGYYFPSYPIAASLPQLGFEQGLLRFAAQSYPRYFVDLSLDEARYSAKFSSKARSTLKRKLRKFAEISGGATDFRAYRTADELAVFQALAVPLSRKTYQDRLLGTGLPGTTEFWDEIATRAREDRVRAYLLCIKGEPVAYLCCPIENGVVAYDYVGFAPEYREHSPGTVLQWMALLDLFKEGKFRVFDFTPGAGQHKETFATASVECADVFFLKPRLDVLALVGAKVAVESAVVGVGNIADRLGIKPKLRAMLRGN